jgi:hypothetical protein
MTPKSYLKSTIPSASHNVKWSLGGTENTSRGRKTKCEQQEEKFHKYQKIFWGKKKLKKQKNKKNKKQTTTHTKKTQKSTWQCSVDANQPLAIPRLQQNATT